MSRAHVPSDNRQSDKRLRARGPQSLGTGADLEIVYGLRASLAVLEKRREAVIRGAFVRAVRGHLESVLRWAAEQHVSFEEASESELDRLAESNHHEGVCLLVRARPWLSPTALADRLTETGHVGGIALDRVRNPYNVGSVLRTAAFFGVDAVLIGSLTPHPALPPQAVRVAEGGAESVGLARTTDLADTLMRLRTKGIRVVGTDASAEASFSAFRFSHPSIVVMGSEREGLSARVRAQCDALVGLRGSGAVESLNVAVAAALVMAKLVAK